MKAKKENDDEIIERYEMMLMYQAFCRWRESHLAYYIADDNKAAPCYIHDTDLFEATISTELDIHHPFKVSTDRIVDSPKARKNRLLRKNRKLKKETKKNDGDY